MSPADPQTLNNVLVRNLVQRPRGTIPRFRRGHFHHQFALQQRLDDLADQAARNRQHFCHLHHRGRFLTTTKLLPHQRHQPQRNEFATTVIDAFRLFFLNVSAPVLIGVGHLRAKQQDRPGKVEAEQENGDRAEGSINLTGRNHA